jgi:hypothetical protein
VQTAPPRVVTGRPVAATILGFITMFQLRANIKALTLRRWLLCMLVLAVVGGAALAVVTGPVLNALSTPFPQLWLLISLQIAVTAAFNSTMLVLIQRWATIPTWLVFILLGNTSSGGGGVGVAAAATVQGLQPRAAQRCGGVSDPRGDVLPTPSATTADPRAGSLAGGQPGRTDRRIAHTSPLARRMRIYAE